MSPVVLGYRLDAMNFFLADVRGGLGPYVSVFLVTAAGWTAAEVGAVLTVSGLIGIAALTPVGALIDSTRAKRAMLVLAVALLAGCAVAIERSPTYPVIFAADVTMAVLGGVFAPAVAALTLGLMPASQLPARLARNAVWDRIGNLTIAALVGAVGWLWTQHATFYMMPLFAVLSAVAVLSIPSRAIDHERARGFAREQPAGAPEHPLRLLVSNRPLLVLALIAATFHLSNASMLPLVGQKLALAHPGYETALLSGCVIVAQLVTVPVAMWAGRASGPWGRRPLIAIASAALVLRSVAFAVLDSPALLIAAQVLDGVATGIWDVLLPLMIADLVVGSGRYSMSRGLLGTVQGIGGSISNVLGGVLAVALGYAVAFWILGCIAVLSGLLVLALREPEEVRAARIARIDHGTPADRLDAG